MPSSKEYSLGDPSSADAKETTLERLRRLRSEVAELEDDVKREQAETRAVDASSAAPTDPAAAETKARGVKGEVSAAVLLQQLQLLRGDLGGLHLEGEEQGVIEGKGEKEEGSLAEKARTSKGLLEKLGLVGAVEVGAGGAAAGPATAAPAKGPMKDGELERRLAEMERMLGANEADVDEVRLVFAYSLLAPLADTPNSPLISAVSPPPRPPQSHPLPTPLLPTVTRLDHLLTLLTQPRHLDNISRRVKVLVSDLERLHESRRKLGDTRPLNVALSGGLTVAVPGVGGEKAGLSASVAPSASSAAKSVDALPPDALQRMDALFSLLPRLDPLLPLTPRLLARLRSLSALHSSAAEFSSTLSQVKEEVAKLGEGEKGLKEVLEAVEKNVEENEGRMRGNLEGLEARLSEVVGRLDRLGV